MYYRKFLPGVVLRRSGIDRAWACALAGILLCTLFVPASADDEKDKKKSDGVTANESGMLISTSSDDDKTKDENKKDAANKKNKRNPSGLLKSNSMLLKEKKEKERYLIRVLIELGADKPEEAPSEKEEKAVLWKEVKSKHFIVFYAAARRGADSDAMTRLEGEEAFARKVARNAERYYQEVAKVLGYQRRTDFWTWDNRVKIFVYPSNPAYLKNSDRPEWSRGMTDYAGRKIIGYHTYREDEFLEEILPHELAHMIFRDFVGFKGEVPLWIDEGVAQIQEQRGMKRKLGRSLARELVWHKRALPLKDLVAVTQWRLKQEMSERAVREFYVQSLSLIDFMIGEHGEEAFERFCRSLRIGKDLSSALKSTYPVTINSFETLESQWKEYLAASKKEDEQ